MAKFAALLMLVIISFIGSTMGAPQRQFGGFNQFGSNAGGFGNGGASNGNAIGTGVGNANAGPNGFGVGLGVGGAVATPLGNLAFGQGNGVAVNPGFGQFGNQGNLNGATGGRPTTGTGVGNANAGPNGFGAAIGVGGAVATPLGNFAVGQGHSAAVNPGIPFGQFNQFQG